MPQSDVKQVVIRAICFYCSEPISDGPIHADLGGLIVHPVAMINLSIKIHAECLFKIGIQAMNDGKISSEQSSKLQGILMEALTKLNKNEKVS